MNCLECAAVNPQEATSCHNCGASLRPARVQSQLDQANDAVNKGRYELASLHLNQADVEMLPLSKEERDRRLFTAQAFLAQGRIYYANGQMSEARGEMLSAVESMEQQTEGRELLANTLGRLGNICYYTGQEDEARGYYERSVEVATASGAHAVAARTLINVGTIYIEQGDVETGKRRYYTGLEQATISGDADTMSQVYRKLAWLHANYGPADLGLDYTGKMLELKEQAATKEAAAILIGEAANIYTWYGDLSQAKQYANEAHNLAQQSGSEIAKEHVAIALTELIRQGSEQDEWFVKAMKGLEGVGRKAMMRREVNLHLAVYYSKLGDETHIRRHLQTLNEDTAGLEDEWIASLNDHAQALLYDALEEWDEAAEYFERAREHRRFTTYELAVAWAEYGTMLRRRAEAEGNQRWRDEAKTAFSEAVILFGQLGMARRARQIKAIAGGKVTEAGAETKLAT